MGSEINLMRYYPTVTGRLTERGEVTEEDRAVSRQFGFDYFDGDRRFGYGGFTYHSRFWSQTVCLMAEHYDLQDDAVILDVGCAKGFMLRDFKALLPRAQVTGIDVSAYAIAHADPNIRGELVVGNASELPFPNDAFDLVVSINTLHNLDRDSLVAALAEIERVSRGSAFIMVDGWRNAAERKDLDAWVLTAQTVLHVERWVELFAEAGYSGDYAFWTVA